MSTVRTTTVAAIALSIASIGCQAPSATPVDVDPCSRKVASAADAIDVDDAVERLDEAITICRDLATFATAVSAHPGTLGVETAVFAARRCVRSEAAGMSSAPICDDPAVAALTGGSRATGDAGAVDTNVDALSYVGTNLDGDQVTIVPDADTPFEDGRPIAIVRMVDLAFSDGCDGLADEYDYWFDRRADPGIGPEASVYARNARDLQDFIGCDS